jgi:hypothetical protein
LGCPTSECAVFSLETHSVLYLKDTQSMEIDENFARQRLIDKHGSR